MTHHRRTIPFTDLYIWMPAASFVAASIVASLLVGGCESEENDWPSGLPGADTVTEADTPLGDAMEADSQPEAAVCEAVPLDLDSMRLTTSGTDLLDSAGRRVLLRGSNFGGQSKLPPFFPFSFQESGLPEQAGALPFNEAMAAYVDTVGEWGMNAARVPFTWEAVEPVMGEYDAQFLERYSAFVAALTAKGLHVIVDFHQDVFARPFCGDGFPLWAIPLEPSELNYGCDAWFTGYISNDEVAASYESFWADENGIQQRFIGMWEEMIAATDDIDGVIGYEIINEPGFGTSVSTSEFGPKVLTPFYNEVAPALHRAAPTALIFFDSTGLDATTATTELLRPDGDYLVFAPHYYLPGVIFFGTWDGEGDITGDIGNWKTLSEEWDIPVLLGEFGVRVTAENGSEYLRANYDALDTHLLHGTVWETSASTHDWNDENMSLLTSDGEPEPTLSTALRPYPAATAGALVSFGWDPDARVGELVFEAEPGGTTEVAFPPSLTQGGISAELGGIDGCVAFHEPTSRLAIKASTAGEAVVTFAASN